MRAAFVLPFMLAFFWATLGCLFIRRIWNVKYDAILVFWAMTVFAFTFVTRILFLDKMLLMNAVLMSAVAFFIPIVCHFGYRNLLTNFYDSEKYPALLYGFALIISATVCVFNISAVVNEIGSFNFFSVLLVQLALASLGLVISMRAKNL